MEVVASRVWTRRREGSYTRAMLHGTSREKRVFPRVRQSDREFLMYHPMPKRQRTCTSSRHLQLLPRLPPLQLPPTDACISRRRTRTAIKPPASIPDRVVRELGHEGERAHAWTHAKRDVRNKGLTSQHGSDVPCRVGATIGNP